MSEIEDGSCTVLPHLGWRTNLCPALGLFLARTSQCGAASRSPILRYKHFSENFQSNLKLFFVAVWVSSLSCLCCWDFGALMEQWWRELEGALTKGLQESSSDGKYEEELVQNLISQVLEGASSSERSTLTWRLHIWGEAEKVCVLGEGRLS